MVNLGKTIHRFQGNGDEIEYDEASQEAVAKLAGPVIRTAAFLQNFVDSPLTSTDHGSASLAMLEVVNGAGNRKVSRKVPGDRARKRPGRPASSDGSHTGTLSPTKSVMASIAPSKLCVDSSTSISRLMIV